jgi:hypothetical protein
MSNIFQDVLTDLDGVESNLLGPSYPYYQNIKTPAEIGMGTDASKLGDDIQGLISYTEVLVSGKSKASVTGNPLGNKFFMKTGAKCAACTDANSCNNCQSNPSSCPQTDRYIYIDNVPDGNIPFISSGLGVNFTDFEGLIPGAMGNLGALNPFAILGAFTSGSTPPCIEISMQTIDNSNNISTQSQYVTIADISSMDPCMFPNNKGNPYTKQACRETFQTGVSKDTSSVNSSSINLSSDITDQIYFACLSIIGIYLLYCLMRKN